MVATRFFETLHSRRIASICDEARVQIYYVAPGMSIEVSRALGRASERGLVVHCVLDVNEDVCRRGYGDIKAIEMLSKTEASITHCAGHRVGAFVADEAGWHFTPTPLAIEEENSSFETPNATVMTEEQRTALVQSLGIAPIKVDGDYREYLEPEIGNVQVEEAQVQEVAKAIERNPPPKFDLMRIEQDYKPLIKYVELRLTGAKISKKTIRIPDELKQIINDPKERTRLDMKYPLVTPGSEGLLDQLERRLDTIRKKYLKQVSPLHGMLVLADQLSALEEELEAFRCEILAFQHTQAQLLRSKMREAVYPLARSLTVTASQVALRSHPQGVLRELFPFPTTEEIAETLISSLPTPESILDSIKLEFRVKDVTYQDLIRPGLAESLQRAFPEEGIELPLAEHRAARETLENRPWESY